MNSTLKAIGAILATTALFTVSLPFKQAYESEVAAREASEKDHAMQIAKAMKWAWKTGYGTGKYVASNSVPVTDDQAWELSPVVGPFRKILKHQSATWRINQ